MTTINRDGGNEGSGTDKGFFRVGKRVATVVLVLFVFFILCYLAWQGKHPNVEKVTFVVGSFALTFTSAVLVLAGLIKWLDVDEKFKELDRKFKEMDMRYGKDIDAKFEKQNRQLEKQDKKIENIANMIRNAQKERSGDASKNSKPPKSGRKFHSF